MVNILHMDNVTSFEHKKLELKYGPAIAQHLMDEIEKAERLDQKLKARRLIEGYGSNTIIYKAA